MCLAFLTVLAFLLVALKTTGALAARPDLAALALLYAVQLASNFQWCVRQYALAESLLVSVERLLVYGHGLPAEGGDDDREKQHHHHHHNAAAASDTAKHHHHRRRRAASEEEEEEAIAPPSARVELRDLRVRYRDDLPDVLRGVSVDVAAGSTVGVCGRTGSGKSSLALALGRLNVISGGAVLVGGVDLATLPLRVVRRWVAVVPQDAHLFAGTLGANVDPLGEHPPAAVAAALRGVGFGGGKTPSDESSATTGDSCGVSAADAALLARPVAERADNLSAGEAQLVCLARALLLDRKVLTLDESTASTDAATDARVQRHLRDVKAAKLGCTVFVIAHRVATIADADLVLVLDAGRLVECGPPEALLRDDHPGGAPFNKGAFRALRDAAASASSDTVSPASLSQQAA
mmetsp:Transcript_18528/g.73961  ORF Transcript_18528/g.73961 Transcript_18528/m.73961 type:complete len:407 (+) Transcript_18528:200-1420(+)